MRCAKSLILKTAVQSADYTD